MTTRRSMAIACLAGSFLAPPALHAQTPLPSGHSITLEQARRVMAAAETEARSNKWNVVIAIVDTGGHLVLLQRMDDTQFMSVDVARQKAQAAAGFRRPTKAFEDTVSAGGGGLRLLGIAGIVPSEGGVPLVLDGRMVGAIGVSGVTSQQDGQIAAAGAAALAEAAR
jgi:glc operon protein GlcG